MSESYWAYWLVLLGVVFTVIMMLIQGVTTSNTQDYYQLKEITNSAMTDSIDYAYYRLYGEVKINKEKFVENFLRRFSETVSITKTYQIDFYDLYEAPPKVSVRVKSSTNSFNVASDETSFDIVNKLDAILETDVGGGGSGDQCSYYDTFDTGGGLSGTNQGNSNNSNSPSNPSTPTNPDEPDETDEPSEPEKTSCELGITTSWESFGIVGTSLLNPNNVKADKTKAKIYQTVEDGIAKNDNINGYMVPGYYFKILGKSNKSNDLYAISYEGKCGWVNGSHMAVDLKTYLKADDNAGVSSLVEYNIANAQASGAVFKIHGKNIPGITGVQLYNSSLNQYVFLQLGYATKLKYNILPYMKSNFPNYKLVIYDAYRPVSASNKIRDAYQAYISKAAVGSWCDPQKYANCYNNKVVHYTWFIANVSENTISGNHSRGCALDLTVKVGGSIANTYSPIHELSYESMKFDSGTYRNSFTTQGATTGYIGDTTGAQVLSKIMFSGGNINDILSEWWHFQDKSCMDTVLYPVNFGGI